MKYRLNIICWKSTKSNIYSNVHLKMSASHLHYKTIPSTPQTDRQTDRQKTTENITVRRASYVVVKNSWKVSEWTVKLELVVKVWAYWEVYLIKSDKQSVVYKI